jgi:lipopolysaccharide export system protein LptC
MNQRWWLVLERAQATLPLLAAASLAGFTWWLVQSSPRLIGARQAAQASSAPDYVLGKARVARFDAQGRLEAVLDGQSMRHFAATDKLFIDQVVLSARNEKGQGVHATANEGEADRRTDIVSLRGSARVVATPAAGRGEPGTGLHGGPAHFAGEGLQIDTRQRIVSSELPVLITQDRSQVQAQAMTYDDSTGIADLKGRVRGRYDPVAAAAKGASRP